MSAAGAALTISRFFRGDLELWINSGRDEGQAGAQDTTVDPLFAALISNDVTLASASPAHNAGADLSSTVPYGWNPISPLGFPPALLSRSILGKYDIGAFVYLPTGPGTLLGGNVTPGGIVTTR